MQKLTLSAPYRHKRTRAHKYYLLRTISDKQLHEKKARTQTAASIAAVAASSRHPMAVIIVHNGSSALAPSLRRLGCSALRSRFAVLC